MKGAMGIAVLRAALSIRGLHQAKCSPTYAGSKKSRTVTAGSSGGLGGADGINDVLELWLQGCAADQEPVDVRAGGELRGVLGIG